MRTRLTIVLPAICRAGGGVSEVARLHAKSLSEAGNLDIDVVTLKTTHLKEDLADWPTLPIRSFRVYGPRRFGFSPGMILYLLRSRTDMVHVHGLWMFHCFAVFAWHLLTDKPYVVTPHGMRERWIMSRSRILKIIISKLYQNAFLRKASWIHVLTEKEASDVAEGGIRTAPTVVIPNFVLPQAKDPKRPFWWLPTMNGRRVYIFFGRIHDKKGWRELCEAWDIACNSSSEFTQKSFLVFCGWPDGCKDFEPTVARLEADYKNVLFAGPQHGAARIRSYSAADVFLLPSKSEGLPMAVLEAWAAGLPTLITRECNLGLAFRAGAAVEIICDPASLAETLVEVGKMPQPHLDQIGESGRALVSREFSEEGVVSRLEAMYQAALERRSGNASAI